jgi:hypothetical protein
VGGGGCGMGGGGGRNSVGGEGCGVGGGGWPRGEVQIGVRLDKLPATIAIYIRVLIP